MIEPTTTDRNPMGRWQGMDPVDVVAELELRLADRSRALNAVTDIFSALRAAGLTGHDQIDRALAATTPLRPGHVDFELAADVRENALAHLAALEQMPAPTPDVRGQHRDNPLDRRWKGRDPDAALADLRRSLNDQQTVIVTLVAILNQLGITKSPQVGRALAITGRLNAGFVRADVVQTVVDDLSELVGPVDVTSPQCRVADDDDAIRGLGIYEAVGVLDCRLAGSRRMVNSLIATIAVLRIHRASDQLEDALFQVKALDASRLSEPDALELEQHVRRAVR